ncbi:MAG: PorP/SprF family type IX secretion system membrane protein [Flavobacteriales bacterium]|nr:PorP/SprF family type IX secretion system membrane protein [Flavobacteriales bacterium]
MKRILLYISLSFLFSLFSRISFGQDIHFSQFYNSPLNLNPALIGGFNGEFRFVGNQRTQWSSVTTPYSTFGLSADAKNIYNTPIGVGLSVYQDKAGDSEFSTLQVGIGVAYTLTLKDSLQTITVSGQPTFTQRSINYDKLQFDNQYNGNFYDANLNNGENFNNDGRTYFNLHGGIAWNYKIAQRKELTAGLAMHNILKPQQTFFNENIQLHQRYTLHIGGLFAVSEKVDILPNINFQTQNKFKELIFGGQGKYHLNNGNYKALYAGVWYRNSDAAYFNVGLDYADFHFGVSYDLNLSSLKVASRNRGGFEFSIIYIIQRYRPDIKRYKACPDYL